VSVLEVIGLSVNYGAVRAVRNVDLTVGQGEVVVVVGPNGAGKSSLLNAISGAVRPRSGEVRTDGAKISGLPAHRVVKAGVVQVPEGRRLFAYLTVHENLLLGGYAKSDKARRDELLAWVYESFPKLKELRDRPAGLLSGGEQQMVAFGRAVLADPHLLLLDEPSMGLAPIMVDVVTDAVATLSQLNLSILMVEQNAEAAFSVAHRAYVLEQGEVVLSGDTSEVSSNPQVMASFLGLEKLA
jgi:branched-chain amino acid transport system ATP-binding protein